ncbi:TauD/TfdA dioxygenase family protein [Dermatobacter hominis]|uniref:TauD/TfdA dioxygenase family protein n=1 Tax=Dermatobacter hominis TaxID=2884263 RepID=UPI001D0F71EF|nr:TauD/TfdA family dioxygenase [Dermatobacter hominis]UDY37628.1 TauD/TfdA family dioxygenase [Dermatobacter hominis]
MALTSSTALDVQRLSGSLGAEIRGIALGDATSTDAALVHELLLEHMVLFFPDQHLTADQHLAFGRHFGELEAHPNLDMERERPEFFELRAVDGAGGVADEWHSDLTCARHPSKFAILQAKVVPAVGGDTLWTNAAKAYDELSAPLRDLCDGLTAYHDAGPHLAPDRGFIHPVVRVHPDTGRRSLFVNEHFTRRIVELSDAESALLLGHLTRWVQQPRFTVRYRWTAGTVAMWDNRCTQHHVLDDFEGERLIQRVTVMGDEPRPAATLPRWDPYGSTTATFWRDADMQRQLRAQRDDPT